MRDVRVRETRVEAGEWNSCIDTSDERWAGAKSAEIGLI